jgi:hypothetical protein
MHRKKFATSAAAAAAVGLVLGAQAQNCANTSVGFTPIGDLGAGLYQGFEGGLYPGGANTMPTAHLVDGIRSASRVRPRDAAGAPDPAGSIVFLSIGMSNATLEFSQFVQMSTSDALRHPRVMAVDGAIGGQASEDIADPDAPYWAQVAQRLTAANVTAEQVQAVWLLEANRAPSAPFPAHAQNLQAQYTTIVQILHDRFPNLAVCFLASRIYAGYATSNLNPEPYAYEQGFTVKWLIQDQIAGSPALNFDPAHGVVEAPWLSWGTYNWADGTTPRSDGLVWLCSDFNPDGTHPGPAGRVKVAQALLDLLHTDPIGAAWYLRRPDPVSYGVGKTTSIGTVPAMGWTGSPSITTNDFAVTVAHALPGGVGILFRGPTADQAPFVNATRWVANPLVRLSVKHFDAAGSASWSFAIPPELVGATACFQAYLRDVGQADGTGAGVSNGLRVVSYD